MNNYEKILKNKKYIKLMSRVDEVKFITDGKWDWEHGIGHAVRVSNYTKEILLQLGCDQRTIELGVVAALLHDIGLVSGNKKGHSYRGSLMIDKFLECTDITSDEKEIIRFAILNHGDSCDNNSLLGIALYLADKLDMTYHRAINSSIQDSLNKEIQKVISIAVEITKEELVVVYSTMGNIDFAVFDGWIKMIEAPKKAAISLNRKLIFIVNNKKIC